MLTRRRYLGSEYAIISLSSAINVTTSINVKSLIRLLIDLELHYLLIP